jgi:hypothetical protein
MAFDSLGAQSDSAAYSAISLWMWRSSTLILAAHSSISSFALSVLFIVSPAFQQTQI